MRPKQSRTAPSSHPHALIKLSRPRAALVCAALQFAFALSACAGRPPAEAPPATAQATPPAASNQESPPAFITTGVQPETSPNPSPASPAPPKSSEVQAALARTYKGAVAFDERGPVVVGDFNGDGSEDIAVAAHAPKDKLAELNDELSNWIVTDPLKIQPPDPRSFDPHQGVQKLAPAPARPSVEAGDALVVVIHGFKDSGWRNPEAMQTYLLKNVAGADLKTEPRAQAQADAQKRLRLLGDVIRERLGDESGFLYWTGASYGWFH